MNRFQKNMSFFEQGKAWFSPILEGYQKSLVPTDAESVIVKKGGVIVAEEDYPDKLIYIKSGVILQQTVNEIANKPFAAVNVNIPGSMTARMTFLVKHSASVRISAIRKSEVIIIPFHSMRKRLAEDFNLYNEFINYASFCDRSAFLSLKSISMVDIEHRLKTFLLMCILAHGIKVPTCAEDRWIKVPIKFSRNEISFITYVTRLTVDRLLSKWIKEELYYSDSSGFYVNARLFSLYNEFELK